MGGLSPSQGVGEGGVLVYLRVGPLRLSWNRAVSFIWFVSQLLLLWPPVVPQSPAHLRIISAFFSPLPPSVQFSRWPPPPFRRHHPAELSSTPSLSLACPPRQGRPREAPMMLPPPLTLNGTKSTAMVWRGALNRKCSWLDVALEKCFSVVVSRTPSPPLPTQPFRHWVKEA